MADIHLHIPASVAEAIRLPEGHVEADLRRELAVVLYAQDKLGFGKARELAGMDKRSFGQLLGERNVPRHYSREDLDDDIRYARR